MSAGDIDQLLTLWAASLVQHDDLPPFSNHADLYQTIDSTLLGDVPWESFSLKYNGVLPQGEKPSWMTSEYDIWFRDPRAVVRNLISNPDFKGEFDYAPYQEYDTNGNHRFQDFMSGNWAWKQAVCHFNSTSITFAHTQFIGSDRRGSTNPWVHVCTDHPWKR